MLILCGLQMVAVISWCIFDGCCYFLMDSGFLLMFVVDFGWLLHLLVGSRWLLST